MCYIIRMNATIEKAIEALETLPEEMQVPLVAHLMDEAEKYRALKSAVQEGLDDEAAGRMRLYDCDDLMKRARAFNGL